MIMKNYGKIIGTILGGFTGGALILINVQKDLSKDSDMYYFAPLSCTFLGAIIGWTAGFVFDEIFINYQQNKRNILPTYEEFVENERRTLPTYDQATERTPLLNTQIHSINNDEIQINEQNKCCSPSVIL